MKQKEEITSWENHFGHYRDFWWNQGFLDLMAERLDLSRHHTLLDAGCGKCHWSKLLAPYLGKPAKVYATDIDGQWEDHNESTSAYFNHHHTGFEWRHADAHALPFEDDLFDIVTCQTLLIHVEDPFRVLMEMKRVLKPGGTLLCVEPNNIIQPLIKSSLSADDSIDEVLDHVKYALICERGKKKLGHGDNSLGDLLPGMLAEAGLDEIEVRLSDKAIAMYPPYDNIEQEATLQQWAQENTGNHDKEYFEAAGAHYLDFYNTYHKRYRHNTDRMLSSLEQEEYHAAGGAMMYLVSGIKS